MLRRSDILEILKNNPEPEEVKRIRDDIRSSFRRLHFIEDGHRYMLDDDTLDTPYIELQSVSSMVHEFEPEVDWDSMKKRCAAKKGITVEAISREWDEKRIKASNNGTSTHLFAENYMKFIMGREDFDPVIMPQYEDGFLIPYSKKQEAVAEFYEKVINTKLYPVMPEAQVYMGIPGTPYDECRQYAGTFDMLFAYNDSRDGRWKLMLYDWKTNENIYKEYSQTHMITLKPPFDDMINEPKSVYTLQLNSYALCLKQLGYEVTTMMLVWLKLDGTYEKVVLPDITDRLTEALKVGR